MTKHKQIEGPFWKPITLALLVISKKFTNEEERDNFWYKIGGTLLSNLYRPVVDEIKQELQKEE